MSSRIVTHFLKVPILTHTSMRLASAYVHGAGTMGVTHYIN